MSRGLSEATSLSKVMVKTFLSLKNEEIIGRTPYITLDGSRKKLIWKLPLWYIQYPTYLTITLSGITTRVYRPLRAFIDQERKVRVSYAVSDQETPNPSRHCVQDRLLNVLLN